MIYGFIIYRYQILIVRKLCQILMRKNFNNNITTSLTIQLRKGCTYDIKRSHPSKNVIVIYCFIMFDVDDIIKRVVGNLNYLIKYEWQGHQKRKWPVIEKTIILDELLMSLMSSTSRCRHIVAIVFFSTFGTNAKRRHFLLSGELKAFT